MDTYVKQFMRMLGAGLYDILTILYFQLLVYIQIHVYYTIFSGACGAHSALTHSACGACFASLTFFGRLRRPNSYFRQFLKIDETKYN